MKFLDLTGFAYLWSLIKSMLVEKSETADYVYYVEDR
jgi:hypothetical protein